MKKKLQAFRVVNYVNKGGRKESKEGKKGRWEGEGRRNEGRIVNREDCCCAVWTLDNPK